MLIPSYCPNDTFSHSNSLRVCLEFVSNQPFTLSHADWTACLWHNTEDMHRGDRSTCVLFVRYTHTTTGFKPPNQFASTFFFISNRYKFNFATTRFPVAIARHRRIEWNNRVSVGVCVRTPDRLIAWSPDRGTHATLLHACMQLVEF